MTSIFVIPKDGKRVIDNMTRRPLPESGIEVQDNPYWQRRLRDGDIVLADVPAAKIAAKVAEQQNKLKNSEGKK